MLLPRSARFLLRPSPSLRPRQPTHPLYTPTHPLTSRRRFHTSPRTRKGLQPHSEDPAPPTAHIDTGGIHVREPASISTAEYHEIADAYIDSLVATLEEKAESPGSGYDVEYSAGVMTLKTSQGTYVLNKQPPNRQIWISSPMSGPKRYDWVWVQGEGQDQKEGTAMDAEGDLRGGQWVYLRDGATLTDLLKKELDVQMGPGGEVGAA